MKTTYIMIDHRPSTIEVFLLLHVNLAPLEW